MPCGSPLSDEIRPRRALHGRIAEDVGRTAAVRAPRVRGLDDAPPAKVVAYLQEENRVLREQLGGRRLRFTDAQRRRLAAKGRVVGRRALKQLAGLVTPDTILRWYRELIAKKDDGTAERQGGRPARPRRGNAWSFSSPPRTEPMIGTP
jgi:hypothetical protein